jgi:hypothetical protein
MTRTTYKLKFPFTVDGTEYTELALRRPKARDVLKSQKVKGELDQIAAMIADLAEVPPKVVSELDAEDFAAVGEVIGNFIMPSAT